MPRNRVSNDLDHVKKDPKPLKTPRGDPPRLWPLPKFKSVQINQPWSHGQSRLPSNIALDDPYAIFSLFFNEEVI